MPAGSTKGRLHKDEAYIARGHSQWADPLRVGKEYTKEQANPRLEKYLDESGLVTQVAELKARRCCVIAIWERRAMVTYVWRGYGGA